MKRKPRIGVTGPDRGGGPAWFFTALSVWLAGGIPVRIQPSRPRSIEGLRGLIIGGGADVDPQAYTQDGFVNEYLKHTLEHPRRTFWQRIGRFLRWTVYPFIYLIRRLFSGNMHGTDSARDKLEFRLLDDAIKAGIPVLGICRGAQLMNVYFGGTLYQELHTFYQEEPNPVSILPVKRVYVQLGSKLGKMLGTLVLRVNALHHQAVHKPGRGIEIVAKEENNVVQAIESTAHEFVIGVQWHPEYMIQKEMQRRIFRALVAASMHCKVRS